MKQEYFFGGQPVLDRKIKFQTIPVYNNGEQVTDNDSKLT